MNEVRDLLMRTRRMFTGGQWTKHVLHKRFTDEGEVFDRYCLIGGLRHSAGLPTSGAPARDETSPYWQAVALLSGRPNPNWADESIIACRNDNARTVEDVIEMIDRAVEEVS